MTPPRPRLNSPTADGEAAVQQLIDLLQRGFDTGDADAYDGMFAADVLWGTPKGQVLQSFSTLNPIHRQMMGGEPVEPPSRFEFVQAVYPGPDVAVAQIRRRAVDGGFSEMAMYVLVRRDRQWWLAGGQNTPITDQLPR